MTWLLTLGGDLGVSVSYAFAATRSSTEKKGRLECTPAAPYAMCARVQKRGSLAGALPRLHVVGRQPMVVLASNELDSRDRTLLTPETHARSLREMLDRSAHR